MQRARNECCGCISGYSPLVSWLKLPDGEWSLAICRCNECHPPHMVEMIIAEETAKKLREIG